MSENRQHERAPIKLELNYRDATGGNFLFEQATNISHGGLFIETQHPLPQGARLVVRFEPPGGEAELQMNSEVMWINPWVEGGDNPNPGMGIRFEKLSDEDRQTIASIVKAIAILPA
jgi:type IV pilus assembly protein PilZ